MRQAILRPHGNIYALPLNQDRFLTAKELFRRQPAQKSLVAPYSQGSGELWSFPGERATEQELLAGFDRGRQDVQLLMIQLGAQLQEQIFQKGRVLEVGCGFSVKEYFGNDFQGEWVGLEKNPDSLAMAAARVQQAKFVVGDVSHLPFEDVSFDVVFSHCFLDVLTGLPRAIAEIFRVLRPGGILLHLMDMVPNENVINDELTKRGLTAVDPDNPLGLMSRRTDGSDRTKIIKMPSYDELPPADSLDLEAGFQMLAEAWLKADVAVPETTYSLLSLAIIQKALEQQPGFTTIDLGVLASVRGVTKMGEGHVRKAPGLQGWEQLLFNAQPEELLDGFVFPELFGGDLTLVERGLPQRGMEIYVADYILAQKSLQASG